jgi:hypothetical protein
MQKVIDGARAQGRAGRLYYVIAINFPAALRAIDGARDGLWQHPPGWVPAFCVLPEPRVALRQALEQAAICQQEHKGSGCLFRVDLIEVDMFGAQAWYDTGAVDQVCEWCGSVYREPQRCECGGTE